MYAEKRTGHGQTICSGCLAKGRNAINWDSMLVDLRYDGGTLIGRYCSECLARIRENNKVEVKAHGSK